LQTLAIGNQFPTTNGKGKSERVISPIMLEVALPYIQNITLFSGEELSVDAERDLSGECDFFFAKHPRKSVMLAPIITLVEAKDEDIEYGQAQCAAQMYGAQLYNETEGKPQPVIYGCASTGDVWRFMRLEGDKLYLDTKTYYLNDLPTTIGIFHCIIKKYL
jgi:hypothetical protein